MDDSNQRYWHIWDHDYVDHLLSVQRARKASPSVHPFLFRSKPDHVPFRAQIHGGQSVMRGGYDVSDQKIIHLRYSWGNEWIHIARGLRELFIDRFRWRLIDQVVICEQVIREAPWLQRPVPGKHRRSNRIIHDSNKVRSLASLFKAWAVSSWKVQNSKCGTIQ